MKFYQILVNPGNWMLYKASPGATPRGMLIQGVHFKRGRDYNTKGGNYMIDNGEFEKSTGQLKTTSSLNAYFKTIKDHVEIHKYVIPDAVTFNEEGKTKMVYETFISELEYAQKEGMYVLKAKTAEEAITEIASVSAFNRRHPTPDGYPTISIVAIPKKNRPSKNDASWNAEWKQVFTKANQLGLRVHFLGAHSLEELIIFKDVVYSADTALLEKYICHLIQSNEISRSPYELVDGIIDFTPRYDNTGILPFVNMDNEKAVLVYESLLETVSHILAESEREVTYDL